MKTPSFVIATDIEDSVVVLNLHSKRYYILNSTAGYIWRRIGEGSSEAEIVDEMALEYDASESQIRASVERLCEALRKAELIVT